MTGPKAEPCRGHAKSGQTRKPAAMVSMPCERECWSAATVIVEVAASMPSCHRDRRALPTVGRSLTPCRSRCLLRASCCPVTFAGWSRACRQRSGRKGPTQGRGSATRRAGLPDELTKPHQVGPILVQARPPHAQAAAFLPTATHAQHGRSCRRRRGRRSRLAGGGRQTSFAGSPRRRGSEHRNGVPQCIV